MAWKDHGKRPGPKPRPKGRTKCTFEGCDRFNHSDGLCASHNMQLRRGVKLRAIRPPRPSAADGMLWCGTCKQFCDESEFGWDPTRDQPKRTCRPCAAKKQSDYLKKNREQVNLRVRLARRGITEEQFNALFAEQKGACAICGKVGIYLDIDHCHTGGHVRGLLCKACNSGIGFLGDDVDTLKAAIKYLKRTK